MARKTAKPDQTRTTSLYSWYKSLNDPVPLDMVGPLLKIERDEVIRQVQSGSLPVHQFRAKTGKVIRVVKFDDLQRLKRKHAEAKRMHKAMLNVFSKWANS